MIGFLVGYWLGSGQVDNGSDVEEVQSSRFLRGVAKVGHVSVLVAQTAFWLAVLILVAGAVLGGVWAALS